MPNLIQRQSRIREVGIIRVGELRTSKGGKSYPAARDTFRLTSSDRSIMEIARQTYGGDLRPWDDRRGQWELLTERSSLKALFDPTPLGDGDCVSLRQDWEMWAGGTCKRRCDGVTCETWDGDERVSVPCLCGDERGAEGCCKLTSRLRVILSEVPANGLWRLNTGSQTFADEVAGFVEQMDSLGLGRACLPIELGIEFREKRTAPGKPTERFPVVRVSLDPAPVSFAAMVQGLRSAALGPAQGLGSLPAPAPALEASTAAVAQQVGDGPVKAWEWLKSLGCTPAQHGTIKSVCKRAGVAWDKAVLLCRANGIDTLAGVLESCEKAAAGNSPRNIFAAAAAEAARAEQAEPPPDLFVAEAVPVEAAPSLEFTSSEAAAFAAAATGKRLGFGEAKRLAIAEGCTTVEAAMDFVAGYTKEVPNA